jgi:hypothetical protein
VIGDRITLIWTPVCTIVGISFRAKTHVKVNDTSDGICKTLVDWKIKRGGIICDSVVFSKSVNGIQYRIMSEN